jgi:hypothetical protein
MGPTPNRVVEIDVPKYNEINRGILKQKMKK